MFARLPSSALLCIHRSTPSLRLLPLVVLALAGIASPADATWSQFNVCQVAGIQYGQQATTDGSGGAIVAWYDDRSGSGAVYAHHVLASDAVDPAWPLNGRLVGSVDGDPTVAIVSDGAGGAVVAWSTPDSYIYAHHVLASGVLDPAWPTSGVPVCTASNSTYGVRAVSDGAGGAILTWTDDRNPLTSGNDIYAQCVLSTGVVAPTWPANGVGVCTEVGSQSSPVAVSDGSGGIIIAWEDIRNDNDYDVYAQRLLPTGVVAPGWTAGGVILCGAADSQSAPRICTDGAGGAMVAWADYRSGNDNDIYVMRVRSTGALGQGWAHNGELVCNVTGSQEPFNLVADGSGGAVASWYDGRAGDGFTDIYVQKLTSSGTTSWTANGVAVCTAANYQNAPSLGSDGAGGVYVAWQDRRHITTTELYLHHVLASGSPDPTWPSDGGRVTFDGSIQFGGNFEQPILTNGSGSATVFWAGADLFSLHITSTWTPSYGLQVSAVPPSAGSVTKNPDLPSYAPNSSLTLTAVPISGHTFIAWSGDASGSTNPLVVTMDATKSITAIFDGYAVEVAVAPGGSGSVARNPDLALYTPTSQVTLTASPASGYGFSSWSGDATGTSNPLTITVNGPKSITANFSPLPPSCGNWSPITSAALPSARVGAPLAWDPVRHRALMFGGYDGINYLNDVWQFTVAQGWTLLSPAGTPPSVRDAAGLIYDPVRDRLLVVAGNNDTPPNDVWQLTLGATPTWSRLNPTGTPPSGRFGFSTIYDPIRDRVIMFGGYPNTNTLWQLSLAGTPAWTQLTPTGTPPAARFGHVAIYDPLRDRMLVQGGFDNSVIYGDIWALALAGGTPAWSPLSATGTPPQVYFGAGVYDPIRDRLVVISGWETNGPEIYSHTWSLSLEIQPIWSEIPVGGISPGWRYFHSAVYEPDLDLVLTSLGFGYYGYLANTNRLDCAGGWWLQTGATNANGSVTVTPPKPCYGNGEVVNLQAVPQGGYALTQWLGDASGANPSIDVTMNDNKTILGQFGNSVGVEETPAAFALGAIHPNPSSGMLRIECSLAREAAVRLRVFDVAGREVAKLLEGVQAAGPHTVTWDGKLSGGPARSGVYLIRYETPQGTWSRRVALIR